MARSLPAGTSRAEVVVRGAPRRGRARLPALIVVDRAAVDVDADDLVALVGELRGEGQADLAHADDGDLHDGVPQLPIEFDGSALAGRRDARVGDDHRAHAFAHGHDVGVCAQHGVAEGSCCTLQRLGLGDGEAGAVALA